MRLFVCGVVILFGVFSFVIVVIVLGGWVGVDFI